eukprot:11189750-Lingulodinium_polyedra.AAC.1
MVPPSLLHPEPQLLCGDCLAFGGRERALPDPVVEVVIASTAVHAGRVDVVARLLELHRGPVGVAEHRREDALVLALAVAGLQHAPRDLEAGAPALEGVAPALGDKGALMLSLQGVPHRVGHASGGAEGAAYLSTFIGEEGEWGLPLPANAGQRQDRKVEWPPCQVPFVCMAVLAVVPDPGKLPNGKAVAPACA